MTAIRTKPIDEIVWQDIADLAASGTAEDAMLEFKGLLPEKNGKPHPWYDGRDQITDFTRDELAAEVVALANAYGGRLIIGIAETQDRPRKAASLVPLPRCETFAEQFEQAFRSRVDPPIGGFQIRPILDPTAGGSGAVIIAVPASDIAPHGIGRPPAAYVRRGTSCEAMTMRDLQSVFWDARTRRGRIEAIRDRGRQTIKEWSIEKGIDGHPCSTPDGMELPHGRGLLCRVSVISSLPLELPSIDPRADWVARLRPSLGHHSPFGEGMPTHQWQPRAHGVQAADDGPSRWSVLDDGTVTVLAFKKAQPLNDIRNPQYPGWYCVLVAQVLLMGDRLRRRAGRPDVPLEIDLEFRSDGTATGYRPAREMDFGSAGQINNHVEIGPVLFGARAEANEVFRYLERQIWNGFGFQSAEEIGLEFSRLLTDADAL